MNRYEEKRVTVYTARLCLFVLCFVLVSLLIIAVSFRMDFCSDRRSRVFTAVLGKADEQHTAEFATSARLYIVIDAGHGGEDGGAVAANGLIEKDVNLDIARRLNTLLLLSDYQPILLRDEDRLLYEAGQESRKKYYDITNRIRYASDYEPSIFVSIHQNKFPIRKYAGFQVYYSPNHAQSAVLAERLQETVRSRLQPENTRKTKVADENIRLLERLKMPAVLAECGFLSNEREAELLGTDEYRGKLAYLIFSAILDFAEEYEETKS